MIDWNFVFGVWSISVPALILFAAIPYCIGAAIKANREYKNRAVPCSCGKFYRKAKYPHCWNCEFKKTGKVNHDFITN